MKRAGMFAIWAWLFLAWPTYCQTTFNVSLVHGRGSYGLSKEQAFQAFSEASAIIQSETGIVLKVKRFKSVRSRNIRLSQMYLAWNEVARLFKVARSPLPLNKRGINFAILPPLIDYSTHYWYSAGSAHICGAYNGLPAFSLVTPTNPFNEDRYAQAVIDIAHELGHLLCAQHDDAGPPYTIMNSAAMQYVLPGGEPLHFSAKSIAEMTR